MTEAAKRINEALKNYQAAASMQQRKPTLATMNRLEATTTQLLTEIENNFPAIVAELEARK